MSNCRPSTISSVVPTVWLSSMVMTPSWPTLFMASEIREPTALSLAEMEATCAIFSFSFTGMDCFFSSSTTKSMAFSMP